MACRHHPLAATYRDHYCAACLLEEALAPVQEHRRAETKTLTIQLPLGESESAAVFLVRQQGARPRLFRLKIWNRPAPSGFLARFEQLRTAVELWAEEQIDRPVAAALDAAGCPAVLTEFSRGVPILDCVRSGRLHPDDAVGLLKPLAALLAEAHARGLAHGSIVAGNVIVDPESGQARLLNFGLLALMAPEHQLTLALADVSGLEALAHALASAVTGPFPQL
jgi:hypothetical protein